VDTTWSGGFVSATFKDKEVAAARFRPTLISVDADSTAATCKQRVAAEALYRAANSQTFEVEVVGWRQSDGKTLWAVNQVVAVDIPPLYLKADLLVVQVNFQQTRDEGTITNLTLMRKDAFDAARALEAQQIKDPLGAHSIWNQGPSLPATLPPRGARGPGAVMEPSS
jgi:prophage tail gpP-like protein